jgi:hypothetical protein
MDIVDVGGAYRLRVTGSGGLSAENVILDDGMVSFNADSGVGRIGAGIVKITDGGSGYGRLDLKATVTAAQSFSVADSGDGSKGAGTLTVTNGYVKCTCNDADGCTVTLSESGAVDGFEVKIVNVSANACEFADTSGVTELAGAFVAGQWDALELLYVTDRWVEIGNSNN